MKKNLSIVQAIHNNNLYSNPLTKLFLFFLFFFGLFLPVLKFNDGFSLCNILYANIIFYY
jgi:hypothetical protein